MEIVASIFSIKTLANLSHTTQRHIADYTKLHSYCYENLKPIEVKSYIVIFIVRSFAQCTVRCVKQTLGKKEKFIRLSVEF
jgi:hypothetical protein